MYFIITNISYHLVSFWVSSKKVALAEACASDHWQWCTTTLMNTHSTKPRLVLFFSLMYNLLPENLLSEFTPAFIIQPALRWIDILWCVYCDLNSSSYFVLAFLLNWNKLLKELWKKSFFFKSRTYLDGWFHIPGRSHTLSPFK